MEISVKKLLGLSVFTIDNGEKVGRVRDYVFSPEQKAVVGLVVQRKGLFKDVFIVPLSEVKNIGTEAVTLYHKSALKKKEAFPEWGILFKTMPDIVDLPLMTDDGVFIAKASSFVIDSKSGAVTAVEVGGAKKRCLALTMDDIKVIGSDVILVGNETAERLHTGKGVKGEEISDTALRKEENAREVVFPHVDTSGFDAIEEELDGEIIFTTASEAVGNSSKENVVFNSKDSGNGVFKAVREKGKKAFAKTGIHYK